MRRKKILSALIIFLVLLALAPFAVKWYFYRSCLSRTAAIRAELQQLTVSNELNPAMSNLFIAIEFQEHVVPRYYQSWRAWLFRKARGLIKRMEQDLAELKGGKDPYREKRGTFLKVYYSEIDGGSEPYFLDVPKAYDESEPWPLVVKLHGHVGLGEQFQMDIPSHREDCITLVPHGKGSIDYKWVSEHEVLQVIRAVEKDYSIDPDRVYLQGHSMGGTGSWSLAVHYPHRFAALSASAGNTDHTVWEKLWERPEAPAGSKLVGLRKYLEDADSSITFAENLLNVQANCVHGSADEIVPVQHSRNMVARLKKEGCPVEYREVPMAPHASQLLPSESSQFSWLLKHSRTKAPKKVKLKAACLRYGRSYWVEIRQFERLLSYGEVEAEIDASGALAVTTSNVSELVFHLDASPIKKGETPIRIDGQEIQVKVKDWEDGILVLVKQDGKWDPAAASSDNLRKRRGLEGPIEDAMMSRFIVVIGTAGKDETENAILKREAESLSEQWVMRFKYPCRIKVDSDVTDEDIERSNLICYGRPDQNLIVRRAAGKLPIQFKDGKIVFEGQTYEDPTAGVNFCYPNPLQPQRYLVVFAANSWQGMFQMNNRFGNWFDWGAYENRKYFDYGIFDERTSMPETFLTFGAFDSSWKVSKDYRFDGDKEMREKGPKWITPPVLRMPSQEDKVHLEEVLPTRLHQLQGAVIFTDQATVKKREVIGRAPCILDYDLGSGFKRFSTTVGLRTFDYPLHDHHRQNNNVIFEVFGDDKLLARSPVMTLDGRPHQLQCSVQGVKRLRLSLRQESGYRWFLLYGAWEQPVLER